MLLRTIELNTTPITGICKQPSMWGHDIEKKGIYPLIYFQKPKWMDEESFKLIVSSVTLNLPYGTEIKGDPNK